MVANERAKVVLQDKVHRMGRRRLLRCCAAALRETFRSVGVIEVAVL